MALLEEWDRVDYQSSLFCFDQIFVGDRRPDRCRHDSVGSGDYFSKIIRYGCREINGHACLSRMVDLLQAWHPESGEALKKGKGSVWSDIGRLQLPFLQEYSD